MIYQGVSLELFNEDIKNTLLYSFVNQQWLMMLLSYLGNLLCTFMLFHATSVLFHHNVKKTRLLLASVISCFIYQSSVFLCYQFIYVSVFNIRITYWLSLYPPYFIVIIYYLIIKVLGVNKNRCMYILKYFYYLLVAQILIYTFYDSLCFYLFTKDRNYKYTIFLIANCLTYATLFIGYFCFIKHVKKHKLWFSEYMLNSNSCIFNGIMQSLIQSTFTYFMVTQLIFYVCQNLNFIGVLLVIITLLFLLFAINSESFNHNRFIELNKKLDSTKLLMAAQMKAISDFSTIKHDIANMMQVYHGYITMGDMALLKKYHQSVYQLTTESSDRLSVSAKIHQNPALYTTLLYKMDKAAKLDINMRVSCVANASNLAVHPLDLSRALGILLDNAIESTVETEKRFIQFYTEPDRDGKFLITVSNSTKGYIDTKKIFEEHYTTKQNHKGIGLYQLWLFASKLPGCTLNVEYVNQTITFYLKMSYMQNEKQSSELLHQYFGIHEIKIM